MSTLPHPTLETIVPGLLATAPSELPFARSLTVRSFLLQRDHGNVLIYGAPLGDADLAAAGDLGGISRRYLNHRHEAMFLGDGRDPRAPLFVHRDDADETARRAPVRATFSRRHMLDDDLEVIPTPGHTPGATAFLWQAGGHRVLFTGDTVYLRGGEWVAGVLDSSDRERFAESLELLRGLDFDVLVPWAASAGGPPHAFTDRADATRRLDALLERLRSGSGAARAG